MYNISPQSDPNLQFLPVLKFEKTHELAKLPSKTMSPTPVMTFILLKTRLYRQEAVMLSVLA